MDKVLEEALIKEQERQKNNIELIASENYVSKEIKQLQGSILTNKYAEGYPNNRYYGGCQYIEGKSKRRTISCVFSQFREAVCPEQTPARPPRISAALRRKAREGRQTARNRGL